jgi:hypothetical protein
MLDDADRDPHVPMCCRQTMFAWIIYTHRQNIVAWNPAFRAGSPGLVFCINQLDTVNESRRRVY